MRVSLTVTAGPYAGQVFSFSGHEVFLVGRSRRAHFRLPADDEFFSRLHFLIEVNPPHCRLADMGSKNGTAVNGTRVTSIDLHDGDLIQAGTTVLRVGVQAGEGTEAEPETAAPTRSLPAVGRPATSLPPTAGSRSAPLTPPLPPPTWVGDCPPGASPEKGGEETPHIPGYELLEELGRGGMGVVYKARAGDGSLVALKTILPAVAGSRAQVARFLREAEVLRGLNHPHIVAFRDIGESGARLYFAMDYVRGTDAARLLKEGGSFPVGRGVALVCQLLEALDYAHARRFVHRDIKPANLLVAQQGGREVARLADFGLARVYQASKLSGLTLDGDVGGTVPFMSTTC
jgi:serine/threonine-protein kinase